MAFPFKVPEVIALKSLSKARLALYTYTTYLPVEVFLNHFGDSAGHSYLLRGEVLVEVHTQLLLQEVHYKL